MATRKLSGNLFQVYGTNAGPENNVDRGVLEFIAARLGRTDFLVSWGPRVDMCWTVFRLRVDDYGVEMAIADIELHDAIRPVDLIFDTLDRMCEKILRAEQEDLIVRVKSNE